VRHSCDGIGLLHGFGPGSVPARTNCDRFNPLRIASIASGIEISNLRQRAAQLMSGNGGTKAFGPEAVKTQMSRLRRLSLHTSYRKLLSSAAFQAMREVLGELVGADSIDVTVVPLIAIRSGAYSPIVRTSPPVKRPIGISSVSLPEVFASHDDRQWVDAVDHDLVRPQIEGFSVLAATSTHERSFRDEPAVAKPVGSRHSSHRQHSGPTSAAQTGLFVGVAD
jgi:hypothetical protein